MIDDASGLQGLGQVLRTPNLGNLYALSQLKQRQEAQQAEMADKKRKEDQAYFEKTIDLGKDPQMELTLNSDIGRVTNQTRSALVNEFTNAQKENRPPNKAYVEQLKSNLDTHRSIVSGYYQSYKDILSGIDQNKSIINYDEAKRQLDQNKEDFMSFDNDGNPAYDEAAAAKLKDFWDNGKIYNGQAVFKQYVKGLEPLSVDLFNRSDNTSRQITVPSSLYVLENKNGVAVPKRDMNGNFIPLATPDAVNTFENMGNVYKLVLENHMQAGGFKNKTAALSDMINKWGGSKESISNNYPPGYGPNVTRSSISIVPKGEPTFKQNITGEETGPVGAVGPTLNLQNVFPDRALTVTLDNGKGSKSRVDVIGLAPGSDGKKKIIANEYDSKGKLIDEPVELPMTDANLQALIPAEMKGQTRSELTKAINDFKTGEVTKVYNDPEAINNTISGIKKAFKKENAGIFSSSNVDSDVAAENVKDILVNQLGIDKVKVKNAVGKWITKDLEIKANSGNYLNPDGNSLIINGTNYDLNNESDIKKLKAFVVKNATMQHTTSSAPKSTPELSIAEQMKKAAGN